MGFGGFLSLSLSQMLLKLLHWILDYFDCGSSSFILDNGKNVRITHEDVHLTLELPLGVRNVNELILAVSTMMTVQSTALCWQNLDRIGILVQLEVHLLLLKCRQSF
uniref:Uncharacterized protein n=1 Tax=Opuntia streptacantha TaxID=393608 RepID=A0A7C9B1X8_OPUST